jgi:hypothetical protein
MPLIAQCGFIGKPVAANEWYRSEGWSLPGVADAKQVAPVNITLNGEAFNWPAGVELAALIHPKKYVVSFPAALFETGGAKQIMSARRLQLGYLYRWEFHGNVYAYSYELIPRDLGCLFSIDLVDDRGDGVFRVMRLDGHAFRLPKNGYPAVPDWAKKPKA